MFNRLLTLVLIVVIALLVQRCTNGTSVNQINAALMNDKDLDTASAGSADTAKVTKTAEEWKKLLPEDVFRVAREKGTERPYTSKFESSKEIGTYYCAVCGNALFRSDTKFESGCGWPSFYEPISKTSIVYKKDNTFGMSRTEVECGRCDSHLGHVFNDGPPPTGLRYCINGVVLDFKKAKEAEFRYNEDKKDQK